MKKIIIFLMLSLATLGYSQIVMDEATVNIKNYSGIEVKGHYKILQEKDGRKEYKIWVTFKNTTDKELFYKYKGPGFFATVSLVGLSSYRFDLEGEKAIKKVQKKKIKVLYPDKEYEHEHYYEKWYNSNETPNFEFIANTDFVIENDYKRYE